MLNDKTHTTMTTQTTNKVAETIYSQIKGNRYSVMVGAHTFTSSNNSLGFKFKMSKKANHVNISLNSMDTYDIEFKKIRGMNVTTSGVFNNVYADQLNEIFENFTGLRVSL